ncbi:MAG: hypothetical protein JWO09_1699 [Bacteroidetes bacterium]|nr:hypothetical protein [Bacteroidota bacterium]
MIIYILLPLLVCQVFKFFRLKKVFLTYLASGTIVFTLTLATKLFIHLNPVASSEIIMQEDSFYVSLSANVILALFWALFFQYIFNRTTGISRVKSKS